MKNCTIVLVIIAILVFSIPLFALEHTDLYVVDKGMVSSYVDKYDFTHDAVYWLVAGNDENIYTIFVSPRTWHDYSVGEIYYGGMSQYLIYEGDDGIARYLGDKNYVHP